MNDRVHCSHLTLLSTASLPFQRLPAPSAARAPKPQETSNKRLFELDVKARILYLFPNHCYLLSCADPAAQPLPSAGPHPQEPWSSSHRAGQSPGACSAQELRALTPTGLAWHVPLPWGRAGPPSEPHQG